MPHLDCSPASPPVGAEAKKIERRHNFLNVKY